MKFSAAEKKVLAAHLFAWAVQQAAIKVIIAGGVGKRKALADLVVFALRNAA